MMTEGFKQSLLSQVLNPWPPTLSARAAGFGVPAPVPVAATPKSKMKKRLAAAGCDSSSCEDEDMAEAVAVSESSEGEDSDEYSNEDSEEDEEEDILPGGIVIPAQPLAPWRLKKGASGVAAQPTAAAAPKSQMKKRPAAEARKPAEAEAVPVKAMSKRPAMKTAAAFVQAEAEASDNDSSDDDEDSDADSCGNLEGLIDDACLDEDEGDLQPMFPGEDDAASDDLALFDDEGFKQQFGSGAEEHDLEVHDVERLSDDEDDGSESDEADEEDEEESSDGMPEGCYSSSAEEEETGREAKEVKPVRNFRRLRCKGPGPMGLADALPPVVVAAVAAQGVRRRQRFKGQRSAAFGAVVPPPAPRAPKPEPPSHFCRGYNGVNCTYSTTDLGGKARIQPMRKQTHCPLCSIAQLNKTLQNQKGFELTKLLKKLKTLSDSKYREALERLKELKGEALAKDFASRVDRCGLRVQQRQERDVPIAEKWRTALEKRQAMRPRIKSKEQREYEKQMQKDRRLVHRKIYHPERVGKRVSAEVETEELSAIRSLAADVEPNDTGLPAPSISERAKNMELWCKHGSWAICETCASLQPQPLQPMDLRRVAAKPTITAKKCTACKHGEYVPQPADVPEPLRSLKPRIIEALRPLEIDAGIYQRAPYGYRIHSSMMTFAWSASSVENKVAALAKRKDRRRAEKALEHLIASPVSSYASFLQRHNDFLERHGEEAEEKKRKQPLKFIEEEGLECALWPHLYWDKNLCETTARASHEKRRKRDRRGKKRKRDSSDVSSDSSSDNSSKSGSTEDSSQESEDDEQANIECSKLGRIKRGFIRKVLSPVIGYGTDYALLHFVYDLSMWTTIGTKKNIAHQFGTPLRLVLKDSPWTPQYWRIRHNAVIDMQRQCGNASLFRTRAPYERSFPYHQWVMHEQQQVARPRMHLAGAETMHMAHVLLEIDRGFFCGARVGKGRAGERWTQHLLGATGPQASKSTVKNNVTRLEFQDGKRKRATQDYHGRGTTHSHSLDFLENTADIHLEQKISATIPPVEQSKLLHGLVLDSQLDYKDSKVPVREEPSAWDNNAGTVLLHHTEEDKAKHVRAYFPESMEVDKCHEEVQQGDGNGAVLRYVATYQQKFSGSMAQDWLNDDASDYSVARRILFCYHPLEPEMWLTLAQERFRQIYYRGSMKDFVVPTPDCETKPELIVKYETASWRRADMSLLEFLRKSNDDGDIIRHVKEKHKVDVLRKAFEAEQPEEDLQSKKLMRAYKKHKAEREKNKEMPQPLDVFEKDQRQAQYRQDLCNAYKKHVKDKKEEEEEPQAFHSFVRERSGAQDIVSLEAFANQYHTRGEKLIAAGTYSKFNDKYFGQWLVLHTPFKKLEDFHDKAPDVMEKVPERYRNFALALRYAPDFWTSDARIQEEMELEANNKAHIETVLSKVHAQQHLVGRYLSGELAPTDDVPSEDGSDSEVEEKGMEKPKLTQSQKRLERKMNKRMEYTMAASKATGDEELEQLRDRAASNKIFFAKGPPGTGKTFVLHKQIRRWKKKGARILFGLPTGQLASEIRAVHPDIDVDTSCGAFLFHRDLSEAMGILSQYDLVVIDEVSMLTAEQFERVLQMWKAADKLPCLVLLGDFWQLPVVDSNAKVCEESPAWNANVHVIDFHEQVRCKDPELQRKLNTLRTSIPSVRKLKQILRGHRAWKTKEPTSLDIAKLLHDTEGQTTIVTCTRRAASVANDLAKKVLFEDRHKKALATLPFSYEANGDNYTDKGKLKSRGVLEPAHTTIYKGLRVFLTKNMCKKDDFVNGMSGTIEEYNAEKKCLEVLTRTGKRLAVHPYTDDSVEGHGNITYFPVRIGYACTVQKVQGSTLPHITIWLDVPGCRAAAYVAMSRVRYDNEYLIAGPVCPRHFVPAH